MDIAELAPIADDSVDPAAFAPRGDRCVATLQPQFICGPHEGYSAVLLTSDLLWGGRYDMLRACVGDEVVARLANSKLFMVGCGAIGCEMLKNYALLGVGTGDAGLITVTDNDVIEKSNLNRQFLFRPEHIRSPKSEVAASSVLKINPDMHIEAHQHKVGPETTKVHSFRPRVLFFVRLRPLPCEP